MLHFNSMQLKFYEVMLATRQTAHLINLGLSINSLINCYHSRAWKIHQQVHGSPLEINSLPHSSAVCLRLLPSPRLATRKFMMLGFLIWLWRVSFPHWLLAVLLPCFFLTSHTNDSWESRVARQAVLECMYVSCLSIHYGTSGWAFWPTSSLPPAVLIFKSLATEKTSM